MTSRNPTAILLGTGITALGSARALGRAGIPCQVLGEAGVELRSSRWYHPAPSFQGVELEQGGELEEYLRRLPLDRAVLIPCSDEWVWRVASLEGSELARRFPSSLPSREVLAHFLDKGLFLDLLEEHSIPHPRTVSADDLGSMGSPEDFDGYFIKPRDSQEFQRVFRKKAHWPTSPGDLQANLELFAERGIRVVLQEYVAGPASNHYFIDGFVDSQGVLRARLVRRRLRMYPPRFGNSSYMVTVDPSEAGNAVPDLERLLMESGYRGIFSAEFKKDERDGIFKILEVNARPWWFIEFTALCGMNTAEMSYRDALGLPVASVEGYDLGRYFIHPYFDISACIRAGPSRWKGILLFLRSLPGADRPLFRWDDPVPGVRDFERLAKSYLTRRFGGDADA